MARGHPACRPPARMLLCSLLGMLDLLKRSVSDLTAPRGGGATTSFVERSRNTGGTVPTEVLLLYVARFVSLCTPYRCTFDPHIDPVYVSGSISGNSGLTLTTTHPFNHILHRRRSQPEIVPLLRHQSQGDIDSTQSGTPLSPPRDAVSSFTAGGGARKRTAVRPISGPEGVTASATHRPRYTLPSQVSAAGGKPGVGGIVKSSSSKLWVHLGVRD